MMPYHPEPAYMHDRPGRWLTCAAAREQEAIDGARGEAKRLAEALAPLFDRAHALSCEFAADDREVENDLAELAHHLEEALGFARAAAK